MFFAPRNVTSGGLDGASEKLSRLAIAGNILRAPHKLCYNSTTVDSLSPWLF